MKRKMQGNPKRQGKEDQGLYPHRTQHPWKRREKPLKKTRNSSEGKKQGNPPKQGKEGQGPCFSQEAPNPKDPAVLKILRRINSQSPY